jgi:hypothetical protein
MDKLLPKNVLMELAKDVQSWLYKAIRYRHCISLVPRSSFRPPSACVVRCSVMLEKTISKKTKPGHIFTITSITEGEQARTGKRKKREERENKGKRE